MKLYDMPASPNAIKVRLVLAHLGLDFEHEFVDLPKGGHLKPEFVKLNPNAKMPVLQDGSFTLWESNAIMLYLAEKHGSDLIPSDIQQRALMHQWMAWSLAHWNPTIGPWVFQILAPNFMPGFVADSKVVEACKVDFAKYGAVLDLCLEGRDFVLGDKLSLADYALAPNLMYKDMAQIPLENLPNVARWFAKVQEQPTWARAMSVLTPA